MRKKGLILKITGITVLISITAFLFYCDNIKNEFQLANFECIKNIVFQKDSKKTVIGSNKKKDIKDILNGIIPIGNESIKPYSFNVKEIINLSLKLDKKTTLNLFNYNNNDMYYVKPYYNEVYLISNNKYKMFQRYIE